MNCNCTHEINSRLKDAVNETAKIPVIIAGERSGQPYLVASYKKETKTGYTAKEFDYIMLLDYCPFCGVKY